MVDTRAGSLTVRIGADTKGFEQGIHRTSTQLRRMETTAGRLGASMTRMGGRLATAARRVGVASTAMGTAFAAAAAVMVSKTLQVIDEQAKLAARLDGTVNGLAGLQIAASRAGVSATVLNSAVERLNRRLGEAQAGNKQATEALQRLGLTAEGLARLDVDERVAAISARVQELGLSGAETAALLRELGVRSQEMINLMRGGAGAIDEARQMLRDYGIEINQLDARRIEQINDNWADVGIVARGLTQQFVVGLSPAFDAALNLMQELSTETETWGDVARRAGEEVADAIVEVLRVYEEANVLAAKFLGFFTAVQAAGPRALASLGVELNAYQQEMIAADEQQKAFIATLEGGISIADRFAEKLEESRNGPLELTIGGGLGGGVVAAAEEADERLAEIEQQAAERHREMLAGRLGRIREGLLTESELQAEKLQADIATLTEGFENKLIAEAEFLEQREALRQEYEQKEAERKFRELQEEENQKEKLRKIQEQQAAFEEAERRQRIRGTAQMFGNLASAAEAGGEKMFAIAQGLAIAQTIMSGIEAAEDAWKWGMKLGGPPLAAAFAGASAAASAARVAQLSGLTSGSKSSGGGRGSAAAAPAVAQQPERQVVQTFRVEGLNRDSLVSGEQLISILDDAAKRGLTPEFVSG